ncbi:protein-disulfide reductase DsbD domain-containing protein, partial [uncultured Polaribacter sp.]|uniref:protein-disulfide reductase DsbD domain-containing protein n=1 Tax=uncultured Polaribacter sp. TaxID=174711 RepID=UPI00262135B5
MKNRLIFLFLTFTLGIFSQIEDPLQWSTSVEKVSDNEFILVSKATIEEGWHLYSQEVPEDGPIPTTFSFDTSNENFSLIGKTLEEKGHTVDDPVFEMKIKFFENSAIFKQRVKTTSDINTINGVVEFMVCDDTKCLAPTEVDLVF